jgi:hypothetical protein
VFSCCISLEVVSELKPIEEIAACKDVKEVAAAFKQWNVLNRLDELGQLSDVEDNTLLHLAVLNENVEILKAIIENLGSHATRMAKVLNTSKYSPLLLANKILNPSIKQAIIKLLLPITLDCSIKRLSEPVTVEEVIHNYPELKKDSAILETVALGCEAVNQCRKEINTSATHPEANAYTEEEYQKTRERMHDLRKTLHAEPSTIQEIAEKVVETHTGNCGELSFVTTSNFIKLAKEKAHRIEIMNIVGGDHVFVVIDRALRSDANKPDTWGSKAIVLDAWSGEVKPASDMKNLMNYTMVKIEEHKGSEVRDVEVNTLTFFNSKHHVIRNVLTFNSNSKIDDNRLVTLSPYNNYLKNF